MSDDQAAAAREVALDAERLERLLDVARQPPTVPEHTHPPSRWSLLAVVALCAAAAIITWLALSNAQRADRAADSAGTNAELIGQLRAELAEERRQRDVLAGQVAAVAELLQLRVEQLEDELEEHGHPVPPFNLEEQQETARRRTPSPTPNPAPSPLPSPPRSPAPRPPTPSPTPSPTRRCLLHNPMDGSCIVPG